MISAKANALCVLKILEEYSDESHVLSINDIIQKMSALYDRKVDRRTIYGAIETLMDFGYDILTYNDTGEGYCLAENVFSVAEIRLLMDAVYSCEYISPKQTDALLEKLRGFMSRHERKNYSYTNIVTPERKSPNPQVFNNITILDDAINQGRKISFTYLDYDYDKKLKPRRDKKYVASPYAMICESEHYYIAVITEGHTAVGFYRIDMMKDIEMLEDRVEISKRDANLGSLKKVVYAHTGVPVAVHLHCQKIALRYVIERFGNDVMISKNDDGTFDAHFTAAPEGLVYWALQYLQSVEVIEPKSVREAVMNAVNSNGYNK